MKWAISKEHRIDNPAGEALDALLPKSAPNGVAKSRRHRALPHGEVAGCLAAIRGLGKWRPTLLCFEFIVLTAARSGEARPGGKSTKARPM